MDFVKFLKPGRSPLNRPCQTGRHATNVNCAGTRNSPQIESQLHWLRSTSHAPAVMDQCGRNFGIRPRYRSSRNDLTRNLLAIFQRINLISADRRRDQTVQEHAVSAARNQAHQSGKSPRVWLPIAGFLPQVPNLVAGFRTSARSVHFA